MAYYRKGRTTPRLRLALSEEPSSQFLAFTQRLITTDCRGILDLFASNEDAYVTWVRKMDKLAQVGLNGWSYHNNIN